MVTFVELDSYLKEILCGAQFVFSADLQEQISRVISEKLSLRCNLTDRGLKIENQFISAYDFSGELHCFNGTLFFTLKQFILSFPAAYGTCMVKSIFCLPDIPTSEENEVVL